MRLAVAVLLAALALAGCGGKPADDPPGAVQVGDGSGAMHGVAVDAAIRPLDRVAVTLVVPGEGERNATTGPDGLWAFTGLPFGAYVVRAERAGYLGAQTLANVTAASPTLDGVRIVLEVDASRLAFIEPFAYDGYLQCSFTAVTVRQACDADEALRPACEPAGGCAELSEDRFLAAHTPSRGNVSWIQSEVQWSGSGLGSRLGAVAGARDPASGAIQDYAAAEGSAPLVVSMPGEAAGALGIGSGKDYALRVFSGYDPATAPPCLPSPVGCTWGAGLAVQQRFTVVTHVFYGFTPPEGWRFGADGLPPVPPP